MASNRPRFSTSAKPRSLTRKSSLTSKSRRNSSLLTTYVENSSTSLSEDDLTLVTKPISPNTLRLFANNSLRPATLQGTGGESTEPNRISNHEHVEQATRNNVNIRAVDDAQSEPVLVAHAQFIGTDDNGRLCALIEETDDIEMENQVRNCPKHCFLSGYNY